MPDETLKKLLIETPVDKLVILAKQKRGITVVDAARLLGISEQQVEEWTRILEEHGMLKLEFPVVGQPKIIPAAFSEARLTKKVEEFKERKAQIEMLAETYLEKSKESEKQINMKFVPVEEELYSKLKDLEGNIKYLNVLKKVERKMKDEISDFEKEKDKILKESGDAEKKTSEIMKKIDSVKASSQDLASDVADALSEMKEQEKTTTVLSGEQRKIEGEITALNREIKIISALAGKKPYDDFAKKFSRLFRKKPEAKRKKPKAVSSELMDIKKNIGINPDKKKK